MLITNRTTALSPFATKNPSCPRHLRGAVFVNGIAIITFVISAKAEIPFFLNGDVIASEAKQSSIIRTSVTHNGPGSRISAACYRSPLVRDDATCVEPPAWGHLRGAAVANGIAFNNHRHSGTREARTRNPIWFLFQQEKQDFHRSPAPSD